MKKTILFTLALCVSTMAMSADDDIASGLRNIKTIVPQTTNSFIASKVATLLRSKKDTEKMIGRSSIYFPIFDQMLEAYELPADLKYITCLETELDTRMVMGTSGATGIWQLMSDVREEFGLRTDGVLDERFDLKRSSEAALKDLKRMYKNYGDWELALAGYNCGAGRLGAAMKKSRSKDFSKMKKYLSTETQQYVDKFVAFTYVMKNYKHHGLKPILPSLDKQCIAAVIVRNYLSLESVASVTGVSIDFIKELNPQFKENYVPATDNGCNVYVPRRVRAALEDYVSQPDGGTSAVKNFAPIVIDDNLPVLEEESNYYKTSYTVGENENFETISQLLDVGKYNIVLWNNLSNDVVLTKGQELTLYLPRVIAHRI